MTEDISNRRVHEELHASKFLERKVPYSHLRAKRSSPYTYEQTTKILSDPRFVEGGEVRDLLNSCGVGIRSPANQQGPYKTLNLTTGLTNDPNPFRNGKRVGATGFCFPRYMAIEPMVPLLCLNEMLDQCFVDRVVIAYPVDVYRLRPHSVSEQYKQSLLISAGIFGEKIGETVALMPDSKVLEEKVRVILMISSRIGIQPTKRKYDLIHQNPTYYDFIRGPFSAADVLLAGVALDRDITVVADILDGEILHAAYLGGKTLGKNVAIAMITTLPPLYGRDVCSYQVKHKDGVINPLEPTNIKEKVKLALSKGCVNDIPEICPVFNNLFPLVDARVSEISYLNYSPDRMLEMVTESTETLVRIIERGRKTIDRFGGEDRMVDASLGILDMPRTREHLEKIADSELQRYLERYR